jgi:hypothetical protein
MWPKFFQFQKTAKKILKTFKKMEKSSFQNEYINRKNISPQFFPKEKGQRKRFANFLFFHFLKKQKKRRAYLNLFFCFTSIFFSLKKKVEKKF